MEFPDTEVFRALAEPTRMLLLSVLLQAGGEANVGDLAARMSIDQSGVSRHLRQLQQAGIVHIEATGRERLVTLQLGEMIRVFSSLVDQLRRVQKGLKCC